MVRADFPEVFVIFGARKPKTSSGSVRSSQSTSLTTNLWPPSVRLVDPFTRDTVQVQGFAQSAVAPARPRTPPATSMAYLADAQRLVQLMVAAEAG